MTETTITDAELFARPCRCTLSSWSDLYGDMCDRCEELAWREDHGATDEDLQAMADSQPTALSEQTTKPVETT